MELTARELALATGGDIVSGTEGARATSFTIDSRLVEPGACFVALRGERDGHDFVADAVARGAAVALVERAVPVPDATATLIVVGDTRAALTACAHLARARLTHATVVGVTGSAGKTATKDLTAAALARARRVHASPGSFNNEAGVPLTLLGAPIDTDVVVTEMGARFAGNIADLTEIARPELGVITHIGLAHAGFLGGREGIAQVKGELLEALPATGVAVLNDECDASPSLARRTKARVVRVGRTETADVRCSEVALDAELRPTFRLDSPWGSATVALAVRGEHQVVNAAQGAAVALELGVPIDIAVAGLGDARAAAHRMQVVHTGDGVVVVNDAYNSSPTSAAAALRALAALPAAGRRVAVLGDMLELGADSDAAHEALGKIAADVGVDVVVAVGVSAERVAAGARGTPTAVLTVSDPDAAAGVVLDTVRAGDAVLVKASRAVGLERVADALVRGAARA